MKEETRRAIDEFWADDLGLESGFSTAQISCVVQHRNAGVQMFLRDNRVVLAVPPDKHEHIQAAIGDLSPEELFSVEWLSKTLDRDIEKILGPAKVHYADETTFRTPRIEGGRELSPSDLPEYRKLQAALTPKEAEDSGLSSEKFPAFGFFSGSTLCAAASYAVWEPSIAQIVVATHPEHRRRGCAKAAVHALADDALNRGLILQWRALVWNENSLRLGLELGFEHYCATIYARCRITHE